MPLPGQSNIQSVVANIVQNTGELIETQAPLKAWIETLTSYFPHNEISKMKNKYKYVIVVCSFAHQYAICQTSVSTN